MQKKSTKAKHEGDQKYLQVEVNVLLNGRAEDVRVAGMEGKDDDPGPSQAI
jgi:hypothetical protein